MKVGVYIDDYLPQDGGGYTLQADVLAALSELIGHTHHHFVLFGAPDLRREEIPSGLEYVKTPNNFAEKLLALLATWPKLRRFLAWKHPVEKVARRLGVEFVWFLSPRHPDIDIPYMTIVFDLQHRLQPWFPEVGNHGEWQN